MFTVPVKEDTNPVNHEGRYDADAFRAAADGNNARDQADGKDITSVIAQ